jgi:hypothetical protein
VIQIYIPSQEERIITIVQNLQSFDAEQNHSQPALPDERLIGTSEDERAGMHVQLKTLAEFEAEARFSLDSQNTLDRGKDWPFDTAIEREASTKAYVAIREFLTPHLDRDAARNFYVTCYLARYRALYQNATGSGALPNEKTKQLRSVAQHDAKMDLQNDTGLFEPELTYHAIIRIQELFGYPTRPGSGYLAHVMAHLDDYKIPYREEVDRATRSGPFLAGQHGRYPQA